MSRSKPGVESLLILAMGLTAGGIAAGLPMPWPSWLALLAIPAAGLLLGLAPAPRPALQPVPARARRSTRRR